MKSKTGLGVDRVSPGDLERLPDVGLGVLADLLNCVESLLAWPAQTLVVIGELLPKKASGDRIIGLISMLGRVRSKAREPWAQQWTADAEPSWDAAVKGNS
eukprot:2485054-Pyramimonas_sp.AAC.1